MFDHPLLVAAKLAVLILGAGVAGLSFLAWRRTGDRLMAFLTAAFAFIALGSFAEGVLFEFWGLSLFTVSIVETLFVLTGLSMLAVVLRPRGVRR
jgi:hypothetical protein